MVKKINLISKTFQKFILGFSLVILITHYQLVWANNLDDSNQTNELKNIDNPLVCLSTSGNGYNWSSIFTWASEMLINAVLESPTAEYFNVACVSGASSGSAFVAAYGSLLQNQQLFPRTDFSPQSATPEEVLILADSLLYMALATDFNREETQFYITLDGDSNPNPPWWRSQFSHERIMLDFGTRVMLAQNITLEDVAEVKRLNEFMNYHSVEELREVANNREIRNQYRQVTFDIWAQSQGILRELYKNANFSRNQRGADLEDFRTNPEHPVRQALAKKPPTGIISLTYGELAFAKSIVDYRNQRQQPPQYNNLVPFVFVNEETAQIIINSSFYQQLIKGKDPYMDKYVIAVVDNYLTMLNYALREPDLSPVLVEKLSPFVPEVSGNFNTGINQYYQPIAEQNWQAEPQFELMRSTRMIPRDNDFYSAYIGVAGGWVDSHVGGAATLLLGAGYAAKLENSIIYFSTFSRRDQVSVFTESVLNRYFAVENPAQAIEEIEKHRAHLETLIKLYANSSPDHQIIWQPIFVDWTMRFFPENKSLVQGVIGLIDRVLNMGFNTRPVATTRQSNYLLARTMNVVRKTLGDDVVKARGFIFDRAFEDKIYQ